MSGLEKVFHEHGNEKKARVQILISDKIDFKIKTAARDKEGHYIMINESIQEEDIIIVYIYMHSPNIGAPQYIRQILMDIKSNLERRNPQENINKVNPTIH